jgi:glycosyltransferase involved in cell wall biosynthesis
VVVATRNRPAQLAACLTAVRAALSPEDELVVVDSASDDADAVADVARQSGARLLRSPRPGTCRARNLGWRAGRHDIILFTDDDCRPARDWVDVTAGAMAADDTSGFVTGRVLAATDGRRAQLHTSVLHAVDRRTYVPPLPGQAPAVPADGFGHGANMAWRRRALDAIGGFDETLGPGAPLRGAEDHDAFWRSLCCGIPGRYEPGSVVHHDQWRPRRRQLLAYYGYGVGTGALLIKMARMDHGRTRLEAPSPHPADAPDEPLPWRVWVRRVARTAVWEDGVRPVVRNLAAHFEMAALGEAVKAVGELVGAARARRLPLDHQGRFVASSR